MKARLRRPINHKRLRRVLNQTDNLGDVEQDLKGVIVHHDKDSVDDKRPMEVLLSTLTGGNIAEES